MPGCQRVRFRCLILPKGWRRGTIGAIEASSVGKLLVIAWTADRQLDLLRRWWEGADRICPFG